MLSNRVYLHNENQEYFLIVIMLRWVMKLTDKNYISNNNNDDNDHMSFCLC